MYIVAKGEFELSIKVPRKTQDQLESDQNLLPTPNGQNMNNNLTDEQIKALLRPGGKEKGGKSRLGL